MEMRLKDVRENLNFCWLENRPWTGIGIEFTQGPHANSQEACRYESL